MKIKICDLCGERIKSDGELKVKVKRGQATWEGGLIWERLEICADCARILAEQSKEYRRQRAIEDAGMKISNAFARALNYDEVKGKLIDIEMYKDGKQVGGKEWEVKE